MARSLSATSLFVLVALSLSAIAFVGPVVQQPGSQSLRASKARGAASWADASGESSEASSPLRIGGAALSMLAAIALVMLPLEGAHAAKTGGRIGGSAPTAAPPAKPAPPARPAAPKAATSTTTNTTIINKTTVVQAPPVVVAAPVVGGFGMMGAPVVMAPAPTLGDVIVGTIVGGAISNAINGGPRSGPSTNDRMLENQQRQDERQMDRQSNELELLKSQITQLQAEKK